MTTKLGRGKEWIVRILDKPTKSYTCSILLFSIWLARTDFNVHSISLSLLYFGLLHGIVYCIGRRPVWVNILLLYAPVQRFPYSLTLLFLICMRRFELGGALVAYSCADNPQLLFTLPAALLVFWNQVKLFHYIAGFLIVCVKKNLIKSEFSYKDLLGGLIYYTMRERWGHLMEDEWIGYREKTLIVFLDALLVPQIFNPQADWKLLALLACLLVRVRLPILLAYFTCVHLNPLDWLHNVPTTWFIIRSYKGDCGRFSRDDEDMKVFVRKVRMYQKVNQDIDYEKSPVEFEDLNRCTGWHF